MQTEINAIAFQFFNRAADEVAADDMADFLTRHPYSGSARYLLARLAADHATGDDDTVVTAGLYFGNPLRLNWLLQHEKLAGKQDVETAVEGTTANDSDTESANIEKRLFVSEASPADSLVVELAQNAEGFVGELGAASAASAEMPVPNHITSEVIPQESHDADVSDSLDKVPEPEASVFEGNLQPTHLTAASLETPDQAEPLPAIGSESPAGQEDADVEKDEPASDSSEHQPVNATAVSNSLLPVETSDNPAAAITPRQPAVKSENDEPLVFQSYHTIDYFASQGIRLQAADLGKDRLGQQLKSFTEWLKSMKRLPASQTEIPSGDDPQQQQVIHKAADSIEDKEVVTEAMAEVWAKQGNRQKARDIYTKLSLQNPSKSAYFAAKIDQLK